MHKNTVAVPIVYHVVFLQTLRNVEIDRFRGPCFTISIFSLSFCQLSKLQLQFKAAGDIIIETNKSPSEKKNASNKTNL